MTPLVTAAGVGAALAGITTAVLGHPASPFGGAVRRGPAGTVSLTFDDGPDARWTPHVLDVLAELDVHASFFVLGDAIDRAPELLARVAAAGHRVEVHAATHRLAVFRHPASLATELGALADRIASVTGRRPTWWRPPYGARPAWGSPAARAGLGLVAWSWSAADYRAGASAGAPFPAPRSGDIALFHDGEGPGSARLRTLTVLPALVAGALAAGLTPGPLPDPVAR